MIKQTHRFQIIAAFVLSVLLFLGQGLPHVYANENTSTSKWSAAIPVMEKTSDGIQVAIDRDNNTITYTIPEKFNGDIHINAVQDVLDQYSGTYMPGDSGPCTIKIINQSGHIYHYEDQSFFISTEDLTPYISNGTDTAVKNAVGFDGSPIAQTYDISRTANSALQSLLGKTSSNQITSSMVSDSSLDAALKSAGYSGIDQLNQYYLDYYNKAANTSVEKLEDLPENMIASLFHGNWLNVKESNPETAELGYNWFYNRLLSIVPAGTSYGDNDTFCTIGSYMRGSSSYEEYCQKAFGTIKNEACALQPFEMYINGRYTTNAYMSYNFGFFLGFRLKQENPPTTKTTATTITTTATTATNTTSQTTATNTTSQTTATDTTSQTTATDTTSQTTATDTTSRTTATDTTSRTTAVNTTDTPSHPTVTHTGSSTSKTTDVTPGTPAMTTAKPTIHMTSAGFHHIGSLGTTKSSSQKSTTVEPARDKGKPALWLAAATISMGSLLIYYGFKKKNR